MGWFRQVFNHKLLLTICNLVYFGCGIVLMVAGYLLFVDQDKILLSRLIVTNERLSQLPEPLFYYVALGVTGTGLIATFSAILGCWSNYLTNYCTLSIHFMVVFVLLILEFVLLLLITIWPQCLGLSLDEDKMVKALQGNYGVPGNERFTAAMDLAQITFECCGVNSDINYDTSLWRLQSLGNKDLTLPLTCCIAHESGDFLDPVPINVTLCQSLQKNDYAKARHLKTCFDEIEIWYSDNYLQFLLAASVIAVVEFFVLLSVIVSCTNLKRRRRRSSIDDHIVEFERNLNDRRQQPTQSSVLSTTPDIRDVYMQPPDLYKQTTPVTTFRPPAQNYSLNQKGGYLV